MTQEDPEVTDANQGKHSLSSNILGAVLSGDYRLAADILNSISITTMTDAMKEKLLKVFSSFVEFEKQLKKKDKLNLIENEPQLNAMVDRYEAVLYDMGDLASEIEDRNTRIYLTIMAERLVELAKKFNNQHINNRLTIAMPSSLMNSAARINLLNQLYCTI